MGDPQTCWRFAPVDELFNVTGTLQDGTVTSPERSTTPPRCFHCPLPVPGTDPPQRNSLRSTFEAADFPYQSFLDLTATPVAATAVTPEPGTLAFLGTGLLALAGMRRRLRD